MASKIEQQLGHGDLIGRFGGEEFAVLLHRADEKSSDVIAEGMRTAVIGSMIHGVPLHYTISIGVITIESGERFSLNNLYKLCDNALYQAKKRVGTALLEAMKYKSVFLSSLDEEDTFCLHRE